MVKILKLESIDWLLVILILASIVFGMIAPLHTGTTISSDVKPGILNERIFPSALDR